MKAIGIRRTVTTLLAVAAGVLAVPQVKALQRGVGQRDGSAVLPAYPHVRHLFVWDSGIPEDPVATQELVDFACGHLVDVIYVECSPVGYSHAGAVADYTAFADALHAAGIQVFALNGYPWWTVPSGAGIPGQDTSHDEGWGVYETVASSGVPFDGIIDDSEAYSANPGDWWANVEVRAQYYLDWLRGVDQRIGSLPFYSTIPFWFDENPDLNLVLDGETEAHPLNWYVTRIVDVVNALPYRDFALGPDGIIDHSTGEMATGPAILGVETNFLGNDPVSDKVSFWEEGGRHMEKELHHVFDAFGSHPNFRGFAIHDYRGYRSLR